MKKSEIVRAQWEATIYSATAWYKTYATEWQEHVHGQTGWHESWRYAMYEGIPMLSRLAHTYMPQSEEQLRRQQIVIRDFHHFATSLVPLDARESVIRTWPEDIIRRLKEVRINERIGVS